MAAWGRRHYGIVHPDDKAACKLLAAILMGKERKGAFRRVEAKKSSAKVQDQFYESWDWKRVRYEVLKEHGAKCMLCGATKESGAVICVDHIKPRALFPALELDKGNMQVLCNDCNMGKGRWDQTDWR